MRLRYWQHPRTGEERIYVNGHSLGGHVYAVVPIATWRVFPATPAASAVFMQALDNAELQHSLPTAVVTGLRLDAFAREHHRGQAIAAQNRHLRWRVVRTRACRLWWLLCRWLRRHR